MLCYVYYCFGVFDWTEFQMVMLEDYNNRDVLRTSNIIGSAYTIQYTMYIL